MKNNENILSLLLELPPDLVEIEEELKNNLYSPKDITSVACSFAEECFREYTDFIEEKGRIPLDTELHSTYVYQVCVLLLKYGLEPNMLIGDNPYTEDNIMNSIYWIDKPCVSADTLKLLLENGGDPRLWVEGESLYDMVDFDVWYDVNEGYAHNERYKYIFESRFHFWLVLLGFIAEEGTKEKDYINHEKYTWRIKASGRNQYEVEIVEKQFSYSRTFSLGY